MLKVDIRKKLGDFKLDVSFETDRDILAILGASGCGKSMTLKCIAGILRPDEGHIELNGRVLFDSEKHIDLSPQKRRVGYLFQQYALFPNMTVEQNIGAALRPLPKKERQKAIAKKISALRLEGLEQLKPAQLSGGQQQRAALARILASSPEALLLDEPFSALDSYLKWQVELELKDVLKSFTGDTLFVSHSRDEVVHMCRSVCVITKGKSEPVDSVTRLMSAPKTMGAALISGCKNYSRAKKAGEHLIECLDWGVVLACEAEVPDDISFAGVRAHYFSLNTDGGNTIPCRVSAVLDDTFSTVVMLETPKGNTGYSCIRVELGKDEWARLNNPERLTISAPPKAVMPLRGEGL